MRRPLPLVLLLPLAALLMAATTRKSPAQSNAAPGSPLSSHLAAGVALGWSSQSAYGEETFWRFMPEAVGYGYVHLVQNLYLRPGVRFGYTTAQPQMPQSVRIEEYDWMMGGEVGVVWDWYIVPSATFSYGRDYRTIKLKTQAPVDTADDRISGHKELPYWSFQTGAGIPLVRGLLVMEPFFRYWNITDDDRSHYSLGVETTVRIF